MTTDSMVVLVDDFVNRLTAETSLGLKDVYYGDQDAIPRFPSAAVEGESHTKTPVQTGFSQEHHFRVVTIIYHSLIGPAEQRRRDTDVYVESVQAFLETDRQLGGLLTWGYVETVDFGVALRGGSLISAGRIIYQGLAKGMM